MEGSYSSVSAGELQPFKSTVAIDIILVLITCGIYDLFWQYRQIRFVNLVSGEVKFSFLKWLLFTILTCGLYNFYHEYVMGREIVLLQGKCGASQNEDLPLISIILCAVSLGIITDAIQQREINRLVDAITVDVNNERR
jgi:hypothetical protein